MDVGRYFIYNSKIHIVIYDVLFQIEIWNRFQEAWTILPTTQMSSQQSIHSKETDIATKCMNT